MFGHTMRIDLIIGLSIEDDLTIGGGGIIIFMEMVFRRIEFWIDGDRGAQLRLDRQEWNAEKIRKRVTKWIAFFIISFLIANVFLANLIGSDELID